MLKYETHLGLVQEGSGMPIETPETSPVGSRLLQIVSVVLQITGRLGDQGFPSLKLHKDTCAVSDGCYEVFPELDKAVKRFRDGGS